MNISQFGATALIAATLSTFVSAPALADDGRQNRSEHRSASSHNHSSSKGRSRHSGSSRESKDKHSHRGDARRHNPHSNSQRQRSRHNNQHNPDHRGHDRHRHSPQRRPQSTRHYSRHNHRYQPQRRHHHQPYYNPFAWQPPPHFHAPRYSVYHAYDLAWDHFGLSVERTLYDHGHWILFGFSAVHGPLRVVIDSASGILLSYHSSRHHY